MLALETCAARGDWTNGRGEAAIATLGALAARLGYPVGAPERRPPPRLVIVQRGERPLYERLTAMARGDATVLWDRRQRERRPPSGRPPSTGAGSLAGCRRRRRGPCCASS
jgi:hypothetical protein